MPTRKTRPPRRQANPPFSTESTPGIALGAASLAAAASLPSASPAAELVRFEPNGPVPPFSTELIIVRSPGGFSLFSGIDLDDISDARPELAVALSGTPLDLVIKVEAWAHAAAPADPDDTIPA